MRLRPTCRTTTWASRKRVEATTHAFSGVRVGIVLAVVLLSGCATMFGGCPPHDTVRWTDPQLYAALGAHPHEERPVGEGLLLAEALDAPQGVITKLSWTSGLATAGHERTWAELAPGVVGVVADSDEGARTVLTAFLANVSAREDDGRLVDATIANRTTWAEMIAGDGAPRTIYRYQAAAHGPWHIADVLANATLDGSERGSGTASARDGDWTATIAIPTRIATLDGFALQVDAMGVATMVIGERPEGGSIARADEALVAAGLPATRGAQLSSLVC